LIYGIAFIFLFGARGSLAVGAFLARLHLNSIAGEDATALILSQQMSKEQVECGT